MRKKGTNANVAGDVQESSGSSEGRFPITKERREDSLSLRGAPRVWTLRLPTLSRPSILHWGGRRPCSQELRGLCPEVDTDKSMAATAPSDKLRAWRALEARWKAWRIRTNFPKDTALCQETKETRDMS